MFKNLKCFYKKFFIPLSLAIVVSTFMGGCVHFHPKPISALQTARVFEARRLHAPELKKYLESNLHREIEPWPPESWDFSMLTLAALYYHPDLDVARAQWGVAKAGIRTAGGRPNPTFGFSPTYVTNAANGISPWILGFNLDVPMETAGKRGKRIRQAKHLSEAARFMIASTAWHVRSRLRSAFLDFYATSREEELLEKERSFLEENALLLKERLQNGMISPSLLIQEEMLLGKISLATSTAQKKEAEARVRLASALGVSVQALDDIAFSFDFMERLPENLKLDEIREAALTNRPDILGALEEYAASQSALQLEIAKQYPDLHLGPGFAWDQGDHKWSLGLSLTLPVLNQNKGPIAEAEARRKESAARFVALQSKIIGEIDLALVGYHASLNELHQAELLLASQKKEQLLIPAGSASEVGRLAQLRIQQEILETEIARLEIFVQTQTAFGLLEDAIQRPLAQGEMTGNVEVNPRGEEQP